MQKKKFKLNVNAFEHTNVDNTKITFSSAPNLPSAGVHQQIVSNEKDEQYEKLLKSFTLEKKIPTVVENVPPKKYELIPEGEDDQNDETVVKSPLKKYYHQNIITASKLTPKSTSLSSISSQHPSLLNLSSIPTKSTLYYLDRHGDKNISVYGKLYRNDIPIYYCPNLVPLLGLSKQSNILIKRETNQIDSNVSLVTSKRYSDLKSVSKGGSKIKDLLYKQKPRVFSARPISTSPNVGTSITTTKPLEDIISLDSHRIDSDSSTEEFESADTFKANVDDRLPRELLDKQAEYNRQLQLDSSNEKLWIEFISFQDTAFDFYNERGIRKTSYKMSSQLTDKKLAIYEKALKECPQSITLLYGLLQCMETVGDFETLSKKWESALLTHPYSLNLWRGFLDYIQTHFALFSWNKLSAVVMDIFQTLDEMLSFQLLDELECTEKKTYLACRIASSWKDAGYKEKSIALLIAIIHWNYLRYQISETDDGTGNISKTEYLDQYWKDERIFNGDIFMDQIVNPVMDNPWNFINNVTSKMMSTVGIDKLSLWFKLENNLDDYCWIPRGSVNAKIDDPFVTERFVDIDEIGPFLFSINQYEFFHQLVFYALHLLDLPIYDYAVPRTFCLDPEGHIISIDDNKEIFRFSSSDPFCHLYNSCGSSELNLSQCLSSKSRLHRVHNGGLIQWIDNIDTGKTYYEYLCEDMKNKINSPFPFSDGPFDEEGDGMEFPLWSIGRYTTRSPLVATNGIMEQKLKFMCSLIGFCGFSKCNILESIYRTLILGKLIEIQSNRESHKYFLKEKLKEDRYNLLYWDAYARIEEVTSKKKTIYRTALISWVDWKKKLSSNESSPHWQLDKMEIFKIYCPSFLRSYICYFLNQKNLPVNSDLKMKLKVILVSFYDPEVKLSVDDEDSCSSVSDLQVLIALKKYKASVHELTVRVNSPVDNINICEQFLLAQQFSSVLFLYGFLFMLSDESNTSFTKDFTFSIWEVMMTIKSSLCKDFALLSWIYLCIIYARWYSSTYVPRWLRDQIQSAIEYSENKYYWLWKQLISLEWREIKVHDRVKFFLDSQLQENRGSPFLHLISIYYNCVGRADFNHNLLRASFDEAVNSCSMFSPFWELYLDWEISNLSDFKDLSRIKSLWLRAISACSTSKKLYMIGFRLGFDPFVIGSAQKDQVRTDSIETIHLMMERNVRVHLLYEEVETFFSEDKIDET